MSEAPVIARPRLVGPGAASNKYSRGKLVVVAGAMPGAAMLAAMAAQRTAAGYVELLDGEGGAPHALVRRAWDVDVLQDERIGAVVIGPGLGLDQEARSKLDAVIACGRPLVIDADALTLIGGDVEGLRALSHPPVLTPHDGEFGRMFGPVGDDRVAAVRVAAEWTGAIVLLKGSQSIVADADGRVAIVPAASPWLASAGTGDVLAGIIGALLAQRDAHGFDAFAAMQAALWLHARAADLAGVALIADDLVAHLPAAVSECLA